MKLDEMEKIRKQCATYTAVGTSLFVVAILMFIFAYFSNGYYVLAYLAIACFIPGIVLFSIGTYKFKKMKREFKTSYLKPLLEETYPGVTYTIDGGIPFRRALESRIIPRGDRFHSEDLITGSFDDVNFLTCDCHVEERRTTVDANGNTHTTYVTTFLGRYFEFEFNKSFAGDILLSESRFQMDTAGLHKIELESIDFNKKFKTFANNDESAFYVLTPHIMERIMKMEQTYAGKCSFSFFDNKMYFSLNNNIDTFELNIFQKINKESVLSFKRDIDTMKEIVDELKLNVNIFKK